MHKARSLLGLVILLVVLAGCAAATPGPTVPPALVSTPAPTMLAAPSASPTAPSTMAATPAAIPRGGIYTIAATADAPTLHPFKRTDAASDAYLALLFTRSLWRYNPTTLEPEPWAAEAWTVSDDRKTFTFKLREMQWSDGAPVTAYDWEWTFEQAMKPANNWPYRAGPERNIESYRAVDARRLEVTLKEAKPLPVALSRIDVLPAVLPKHVWETLDWNDPTKNAEILQPSVVNGPYRLKEWKRDDHATFVRNDAYFRGAANIERIVYRIVPNATVSTQMLLTGEVDAGTVSAGDFEKAKASDKLNLYQWDPASAAWDYLGFNLRRVPLNDVEFRHAIAYATPRDLIAQRVYNNLSKPTYSTFPPSSWVFNPNVNKYAYSIETAQATLARAGYRLDANGKRLGKDGKPIRLKLLHPIPSPTYSLIAQIVQEQLKQLGIDLEIVTLEGGAFLQTIRKEPFDWDLDLMAWSAGVEPSDLRDIWSEAGIPDLNRSAYVNKQQEALWEAADKEFDAAQRKVIYQQIQQILTDDAPNVFLVYRTGWMFLNKRIVPNPVSPMGISYDLSRWHIVDSGK